MINASQRLWKSLLLAVVLLALSGCAVDADDGAPGDEAVAINEMLERRSVAEWLRRGPVAGCGTWFEISIKAYVSVAS